MIDKAVKAGYMLPCCNESRGGVAPKILNSLMQNLAHTDFHENRIPPGKAVPNEHVTRHSFCKQPKDAPAP